MAKMGCAKCGKMMKKGGAKKMAAGGSTLSGSAIKKAPTYMYGIPQENMGQAGQYGIAKKGGSMKNLKKAKDGIQIGKKKSTVSITQGVDGKDVTFTGTAKEGNRKAVVKVSNPDYGSTKSIEKFGRKGDLKKQTVIDRDASGKLTKITRNKVDKSGDINSSVPYQRKAGGATKTEKFAALAPPYNVATAADRIAGATKKAKFGASVKVQRSPKTGKIRSAGDQGYAAVGQREPGRIIKKTLSKKAAGGPIIDKLKAKLAERKITKAIKKSVKSSGKIIK